jgi:hypothetical protein
MEVVAEHSLQAVLLLQIQVVLTIPVILLGQTYKVV